MALGVVAEVMSLFADGSRDRGQAPNGVTDHEKSGWNAQAIERLKNALRPF
jgi:hypothetical protein